jgi:hypothetical protein
VISGRLLCVDPVRIDLLFTMSEITPTHLLTERTGETRRDRTDDLMLAKHALSQLSYAPVPENTKLVSIE